MSTPESEDRPIESSEHHAADRRPLKIAVLSRDPSLYSTRRLVQAARARGHDARVIDVLREQGADAKLTTVSGPRGDVL